MSDYIERGTLMDKIGERLAYLREKNGDYDPYTDGYEECYCEAEEAPAADVASVVHGTWEESIFKGFVQCSVCHDCCVDDDWVDGKKWGWCPRCGAKMDGGDDDEQPEYEHVKRCGFKYEEDEYGLQI